MTTRRRFECGVLHGHVFVFSNLANGEPQFTLGHVALNDMITVVAFTPIVGFLLGLSSIGALSRNLALSVVLYILTPVIGRI